MHKLCREVRFSVNPFLVEDAEGANSYCAKPAGDGLSLFLELGVGLIGQTDPVTGFVVNVVDIDKYVRRFVVPVFSKYIRDNFNKGCHIGFEQIAGLLKSAKKQLDDKFDSLLVGELTLKLNPFRKVAIDCEDLKMIYISEKFEFAAMHRLWNENFSDERNFKVFGKCANPSGHGHNYIIEVTVKKPTEGDDFCIGDFERAIDENFIELVDHKNLNVDVEGLGRINPTVENIAVFAWGKLAGKFEPAKLHCITVWETDKTSCSYYG